MVLKLNAIKMPLRKRTIHASENKPLKKTSLAYKKGSRFILFVGDEGAILVHAQHNTVLSRQFIPDGSASNLAEFTSTIKQDSKAPVLLILDSMDQSYIQQTLPPVSALSVNKLIKRRLDRDFAADDIKGALLLGREKTGRKDWNFLMISVEKSPQITVWLDFIATLPNRFQGIYLVSVEVELLIKHLDVALDKKKEPGADEWKFFVSHNKVGGYRQVVLHNGRILFTRLAQPVGEPTPEVTAGNIEQEILNTIEYMKRLSFSAQTNLDIYIIASSSIKALIDKNRLKASSLTILTPYEMAQALNIEGATQPSDQFGDVILATSIGNSKKHILTLSTPESKELDKLYSVFQLQRAVAATIALALICYIGVDAYSLYGQYANSKELQTQKLQQQKTLEALQNQINSSPVDINVMNDMIDLYQLLLLQQTSPLPFISRLHSAMKPPVRLSALDWSYGDNSKRPENTSATMIPATAAQPTNENKKEKILAKLTWDFSQAASSQQALKMLINDTLERVKTQFPGSSVTYASQPSGLADNEKLELNFSESKQDNANVKLPAGKPVEAQMIINGEMNTPPQLTPQIP